EQPDLPAGRGTRQELLLPGSGDGERLRQLPPRRRGDRQEKGRSARRGGRGRRLMRYLPHTEREIDEMLAAIGAPSVEALFDPIPKAVPLHNPPPVEPALDEARLMDPLTPLAAKNVAASALSFLGAGIYDHHVPPVVDQLLLRGEFYTAYTPYQAEVAQGTLQAIFEFQTICCELFGMPVANASMYDGASAAAEGVLMARRLTKRTHVLVSDSVHPEYTETIRTYVRGLPGGIAEIETVPHAKSGAADLDALKKL